MKKADAAVRDALKVNTCKASVRPFLREEKGKRVYTECGKQWLGRAGCPNRSEHLLPMKTGFCSNGWCEGKKAKDWKGRPVPTCEFYLTCPCNCHDDLDRLFAMTDQERILVESSGYAPPPRTYWMPSDDPNGGVDGSSTPLGDIDPATVESAATGTPPPPRTPAVMFTESGRTAKGVLESWVKQHCDIWLIDQPGEPCTPGYLAHEIGRSEGITPPSVGAIDAVFKRWEALGFAVIERKPTRFARYTDDGVRLGLDRMKADVKRRKRLQLKDDYRNARR